MKPAPLVTVVIPTWNWSRALRCAITTVLRQTFVDFELLVVGDCCTDDSAAVVAAFNDERVRWHNLPLNVGNQAGPNNVALQQARGEYVAYLGHDDLWLPDHLQTLVHAAVESRADLAVAGILMLGPPASGLRAIAGFLGDDTSSCEPAAVPPSAFLHRIEVGRAIGGWRMPGDCELPPDMDFLKRCWEHRRRVAGNRRITVIKFNACWRPNCYLTLDASEQEEWLARIETEKDFLDHELHETLACFTSAKLMSFGTLGSSAETPKGWFATQMRRVRGLSGKPCGVELVPGGVRYTAEHPGLLQKDGITRKFRPGQRRFAGPDLRPGRCANSLMSPKPTGMCASGSQDHFCLINLKSECRSMVLRCRCCDSAPSRVSRSWVCCRNHHRVPPGVGSILASPGPSGRVISIHSVLINDISGLCSHGLSFSRTPMP